MEKLLGPETFDFFVRYLLAGYVFMTLRSWSVSAERPKLNETLVESVILSLLNQVVALGTVEWVPDQWNTDGSSTGTVLLYIVQPALLGLVLGKLVAWNVIPAGLRRLVMPTARPVSEAYEFAFQVNPEPGFVIIAFQDGREVYGYFGSSSLASESLADGGLYLERLYEISDDGTWTEVAPRRSAWISLNDVRSIEFLKEE